MIRRSGALAALLLALLLPAGVHADVPASVYARVNAALLDGHVIARYRRLDEAMTALADGARDHCAARGPGGDDTLRARYHAAMDAWMGVEHLRFGPVEQFMRAHRLYSWPQARGRIGDALRELLQAGRSEAIGPERVQQASVAAQGLPAVEHLLYSGEGPLARDAARCALLVAITASMQSMAGAIAAEWQHGESAFAHALRAPGPDNVYLRSHQDATLVLFKALHDGLQRIASVKLAPVVGDSAAAVRARLAESAPSARALRNIIVNLEALQALYAGEGGAGLDAIVRADGSDAALDALLHKAFRITLASARAIEGPLAQAAADRTTRPQVEKLATQALALEQIVRTRLAKALGMQVGFNALDGD
jgi:hypothetical protein